MEGFAGNWGEIRLSKRLRAVKFYLQHRLRSWPEILTRDEMTNICGTLYDAEKLAEKHEASNG